ncbi:CFEM domain-containing protein [Aspergillus affinis]|uniref:CFEM domain-containing protein n=1 Tax=Aspergillus affinis TaxID=1070780 RepID=UPI0022FE8172|nr:uncharacterized protein KD926_000071 [Aspergillus affinis]KAI9037730.1 hypothetical protein KD926_000071 [Aspergillus affinis]
MKLLHCLLCILALVMGLHAADPDFNKFPSCALDCGKELFPNCDLTNSTCFCAKSSYRDDLLTSVTTNCTTKEEFITKRLSAKVCGIEPRKGPAEIDGSTLAPLILGAVFFIIRIAAKSFGLAGGWGWDDYTIIVSFVMAVGIYVLNIYMIRFGFGMDIWDIHFDTITKFYKYFEGLAVMYKIQISLAKISVCLFLLRIFQSRPFRYCAYILIGLNAAIGITWALVDSLRCIPPHLDWTGWMNEEEGQCINFIDSILVNCLANIVVDTALIIMPVYEVAKLQLPLRKKLTVGLMFVMGSVLTIIAIIRVVVFWNNRWGENQTYGLYPLIHWSVIECQISVMCACLPASRALISHFFPGILGNSTRRTYGTGPSNNWYNKEPSQGNSKIAKSVSYSVNYAPRSVQDDSTSMVELMDVEGAARYAR